MSYISKTLGEKVTLGALLTKDGVGLTGLSPTIEIRRNSDQRYLDFSTSLAPFWVLSGGQREMTLTPVSWLNGWYVWEFDQGFYDQTLSAVEYTVIYRNTGLYTLLETEVVGFAVGVMFDLELIRKVMVNKQILEQTDATTFTHTVFDDDTVTPVYEGRITRSGSTETRERIT